MANDHSSTARPRLCDDVLEKLRSQKAGLSEAYGVSAIGVFGSVTRDEASAESDIDVLVDFENDRVFGLFKFVELQLRLESILGRPVDLATPETLHAALRDQILTETIYA